jgi:hypothetical protein
LQLAIPPQGHRVESRRWLGGAHTAERQGVGQAGPHLGAVGVLAAKAIVSRLQLCFRPSVIFSVVASARLVLRQLRWASIAGIAEKEQ